MTKTVIKKIKIVKKKDNPIKLNANEKKDSTTLQKVSNMMESCSLSDENKIIKLETKVNELNYELKVKREQLRNIVLFLNGEKECICMNKKSKVGKIESIDKSLLDEEPLLDEDGERYNYFQNVMCVSCLVDYYYKRLNKVKKSTKKSNK